MEQNFGLNLYRAAAIVMIVGANALYLLQWHIPVLAQFVPIIGFLGLESLFILAGVWLAQKLYPVYLNPNFSFRAALIFVGKSLTYILPLYWLVLGMNCLLAWQMNYPIPTAWKYILLIQNFSQPIPAFFPESWIIPIIALSFVVFPILLSGFSSIVKYRFKTILFPLTAVFVVGIFVWTKSLFHFTHEIYSITDWDTKIKTVAIYRLDAVFYGVLIGWLLRHGWAQKFKLFFVSIALIGIVFFAIGVGFLQLTIENYPLFWNVIYLPLASIVLACALAGLHSISVGSRSIVASVKFLSQSSYSIYLVHFSLVLLLFEHFLFEDLPQFQTVKVILLAVVYFAVAIGLGILLHKWIEKPLRKRLKR